MTINVGETTGPLRTRNRRATRVWARLLEIVLLAVAGLSLALLLTQDITLVTRWLLSPPAVIIVVVVFVEYLIIKGGDRSRLYLIELDRMRQREQAHVARTRRALSELERLVQPEPAPDSPDKTGSGEGVPASLREALLRINKILRPDLEG